MFGPPAAMFVTAGYDKLQSVKDVRELRRTCFLPGARKGRKSHPNLTPTSPSYD